MMLVIDELFKRRGIGHGKGHRKMIAEVVGFVKSQNKHETTIRTTLNKG